LSVHSVGSVSPVSGSVVVLIPAYNEEKTIARVIITAKRFADTIIVCDDGSSDMTGDIAEGLGATVLRHKRNMGKGASLRTLIEEAKRFGPKAVVTIDGDGQHDPAEIPDVAAPVMKDQADVVIGMRSKSGVMPRERIIGNRVLDEATSKKAGMKLEDTQSGFRAYSRRALAELDFTEKGMAVESQTLIDATKAGLRITAVPVSTTYEGAKRKRSMLVHGSMVLDYILTRTVVESPLLYLGVPGLAAVLIGIIAGILVVNTFLQTHLIATGTALIAAIFIVTGVIGIATGLILKFLKVQMSR